MTPESWWRRRAGCARTLMAGSFSNGMGRMDRVEPRLAGRASGHSRPARVAGPGGDCLSWSASKWGVAEESARAMACGIEYLHTASLIFDDLPAMDDARMRRGAACVHVVHGESVAMLAALAMINRAYSMIWQGIHQADLETPRRGGRVGGRAARHRRRDRWSSIRFERLAR